MSKYPMSWRRWNTEEVLFAIIVLIVSGAMTWLTYAVIAEIEECGGVAKCLGDFVGEFDEARRGTTP